MAALRLLSAHTHSRRVRNEPPGKMATEDIDRAKVLRRFSHLCIEPPSANATNIALYYFVK